MKRVVLDTNVLISAYAFKGRVAALRPLWEEGKLRLLFCKETWGELVVACQYPKFDWPVESRRDVLETALAPWAEKCVPYTGPLKRPSRDHDDDIFLRLALGSQADALVTGDKDLLELDDHYPFPILKPSDFKARFFYDFMAGDATGEELPKTSGKKKKRARS